MSSQPQYQGSINYNYVSTPTIVNNFVGSVLWYDALFGVQDFSKTTALMPEAIAIGDGGANDLADFANGKLNFSGTNLGRTLPSRSRLTAHFISGYRLLTSISLMNGQSPKISS